ncbi:helix-turn-helix domain-containing protein [Bowmanella dokdonensis]|uniref:Helix-turn-helix transcriptional regulator n=1 Tax=Bowmanella dokdonensis TaxID=751969 RepID=A0A939DNH2_9ALTE|nr:helix-turn-helix domain-containing protein [Bowmanella dokdonensis]MBN7825758.1 helix-turn-helix transcriptional regulator [Bowmanella dokdonensis]
MAKRVVPAEKPDMTRAVDMAMLGAYIRYKRSLLGITLEDAASLSGVSKQAYSNVETGKANTRADTLFKALEALGIQLQIVDIPEQTDDWG